MSANLPHLTEALLTAARRAGAEQADALAVAGTSVSIDIRAGKLEQAERSEGVEIGLRVLIGGRQACVSASDISDATIRLGRAGGGDGAEAPVDPHAGLAAADQITRDWNLAALETGGPGG